MLRGEVNYLGKQTYAQLLRCPEYEKQPILIVTLSFDKGGQDNLFNTSRDYYNLKNNCTILNDSKISFDTRTQTIGNIPKAVQNALQHQDVVLVLTAHGNVQWLFGETPGQEGGPAKKFAEGSGSSRRIVKCAYGASCWTPAGAPRS